MSEIEWLDKVKKNFEYKEESTTMNDVFREMYQGYDWGSIVNNTIRINTTTNGIIHRIVVD